MVASLAHWGIRNIGVFPVIRFSHGFDYRSLPEIILSISACNLAISCLTFSAFLKGTSNLYFKTNSSRMTGFLVQTMTPKLLQITVFIRSFAASCQGSLSFQPTVSIVSFSTIKLNICIYVEVASHIFYQFLHQLGDRLNFLSKTLKYSGLNKLKIYFSLQQLLS